MKTTLLRAFALFSAAWLCMGGANVWAENEPVDAGDGYYTISNAAQLRRLSELSNDAATRATWNKRNFKLAADIDLENINFTPLFLMEQSAGSSDKAGKVSLDFRGIFDGQGHTIKNLSITMDESSTYQVGLFSRVFTGTLKNLMLKDVRIKTQNATTKVAIGGVVGRDGSATIENCGVINISFDLAIVGSGTTSTGAVAGYLSGSTSSIIKNCYSNNATYSSCGGKGSGAIETECFNGADVSAKLTTGELCYLLNGSSSENPVWFQTISSDEYPVLDSTHGTVFYNGPFACDGVTPSGDPIFGNTDDKNISGHADYVEWLCPNCGALDPAFTMTPVAGVYEIDIPAELKWFAAYVNEEAAAANAKLTADIDMAGKYWTPMTGFAGTFDGDNFTISNLDAPFCYSTEGDAVIRNLTLSADATLVYSGTEHGFGAFVCQNNKLNATGSLLIENCVNNTKVDNRSGKNWTGGFIGGAANGSADVTTTIRNCVNNATIKSTAEAVSGFIGNSRKGDIVIENCVNNGAIDGPKAMGGFIGQAQTPKSLTITGSHNTANVKATGNNDSRVAGIVGALYESSTTVISGCWNVGDVSGEHDTAAGILGYMAKQSSSLTISDCYNVGKISAEANAAGILGSASVGSTAMNLTNCWNNGAVTGGDAAKPFAPTTAKTTCTNCYDVNGAQTGVTEVTAAQLESGEVTYLLNGDQSSIVWKQTLSGTADAHPVLDSEKAQVYRTYKSGTASKFSNTLGETVSSMTLTDAEDYAADADFIVGTLTYARELVAGGYHSLCLPFAINSDMLSEVGGKLFTVKTVGDDAITLEETPSVAAGTPCFASVTSNFTFGTMSNVDMVASEDNSGSVKGTFTEITDIVGVYKLDSKGEYFALTAAKDDEKGISAPVIKPFRSYIPAGGVGVKTLNILLSDGTITGLTPALSEEREAVIYDLAGRRVQKATKGLYIVNGKKILK